MQNAFKNCKNLTTAPNIPANVINIYRAFSGCWKLSEVNNLPNGIVDMGATFYECTSLITAPTIPASVMYMSSTFAYCGSLVAAPNIPAIVTEMNFTFRNCTNLKGNIFIQTNRITNTRMNGCFLGTTLPKNVYIPITGYSASNNTWNAARNSTYGINGKNGVTIYDINTYTG